MKKAYMTPRENMFRFFSGKEYEKIPHSEDFLPFQPEELCENVCRGAVFQQRAFDTNKFGGKDYFRVEWEFDPSAGGSMEVSHLLDDILHWEDRVVFPDLDKIDWEAIADKNSDYLKTDKLIRSTIFTGFYERLISFLGFENAAMALVDEDTEDSVKALFSALADFYIELIERMHKYFNVEYVQLHDDWGTQHSQMFSIDTLEEMILPYIKRVVDATHRLGCLFEFHSCGQITPFVPHIINMGADTWCGQTSVMDKPGLVAQYGDLFRFGVGILPPGDATENSIRTEVRELKKQYTGKKVWYFISSMHRPDLIAPIVDELESTLP